MEGEGNAAPPLAAPFEELPLTPFPESTDTTPAPSARRLAFKWIDQLTRTNRNGGKADTVQQVEPQFAEFLRLKVSENALDEMLDDDARSRNEQFWQFAQRIEDRFGIGKKAREPTRQDVVANFRAAVTGPKK